MVAIYVVMLLGSGTLLAIPQLVRWIVDHGIARDQLGVVWRAVGLLLLLALARAVLAFLMGRWTEIVSQGVATDLRQEMFNRFTVMSVSLISRMESGQLLQRAVQDVERIRFLTGRAVLRVVDAAVLFVGTLVLLIGMNPLLGVLCLATMPLLAYRGYHYGRRQRPLSTRLQQQLGDLTGRLEQNLRGVRLVKAFAQEHHEVQRFRRRQRRLVRAGGATGAADGGQLAAARPDRQLRPGHRDRRRRRVHDQRQPDHRRVGGVHHLRDAAVRADPPRRYGHSDAGDGGRFRRAHRVGPGCARRRAGAARRAPAAADSGRGDHDRGVLRLRRQRRDGAAGHAGRWALREVNLDVPAGTIVALLGATGAGKTTLAGLVLRLYDPQTGSVRIDGIDVREVTIASLRSQIGVVMQDPVLFAASIRDNIAFGAPDATDADVYAAAQAACIHDHVVSLDEGYDTMVGERGVTLSGGQRQRVAIARAILVDPRILILDDATSSVDAHTEELIHDALRRLLAGRTSFIIAQRLSTLELADVVVVLDDGHITAQGGHEELLVASATYRAICAEQLQLEGAGAGAGSAGRPPSAEESP